MSNKNYHSEEQSMSKNDNYIIAIFNKENKKLLGHVASIKDNVIKNIYMLQRGSDLYCINIINLNDYKNALVFNNLECVKKTINNLSSIFTNFYFKDINKNALENNKFSKDCFNETLEEFVSDTQKEINESFCKMINDENLKIGKGYGFEEFGVLFKADLMKIKSLDKENEKVSRESNMAFGTASNMSQQELKQKIEECKELGKEVKKEINKKDFVLKNNIDGSYLVNFNTDGVCLASNNLENAFRLDRKQAENILKAVGRFIKGLEIKNYYSEEILMSKDRNYIIGMYSKADKILKGYLGNIIIGNLETPIGSFTQGDYDVYIQIFDDYKKAKVFRSKEIPKVIINKKLSQNFSNCYFNVINKNKLERKDTSENIEGIEIGKKSVDFGKGGFGAVCGAGLGLGPTLSSLMGVPSKIETGKIYNKMVEIHKNYCELKKLLKEQGLEDSNNSDIIARTILDHFLKE